MDKKKIDWADATAESMADAMATLDMLPPSRARSMVQTKLDEAMMWLDRSRPVKNEVATSNA